MARSANNLKAVLRDTADAIRAKTGNSDPIVPRDFADEIAAISGGGEVGTFDFSGSDFTDVNMKLFSGNSDFVEEPATIILPSTVTTISVNMFDGASGDFKLFLSSNPTISSSYIPANVDVYFDVSENMFITDAYTDSGWSTLTSQIFLIATGIESGVALQPYTTGSGVPITWYTDETFTTIVTTSTGSENKYYGKVLNPSASRVTYCVRTLNLTDASVDIVDGSGNHYGLNNRFIPVGTSVTITPSNTDPSKDVLIGFNINGTDYINSGTATITVNADIEVVVAYNDVSYDPILENNDWQDIRECCESGFAANYWSIGDTKTDVGTDGYTRTFRIVDMSGLYGKHVVFESVYLEGSSGNGNSGVAWNTDNNSTVYETSSMNVTVLPGVVLRYSSTLQQNLTNTTVKVGHSNEDDYLDNVTNKLFLAASKEMYASPNRQAMPSENEALTTFGYYVSHSQMGDHSKTNIGGTGKEYWLRSPCYYGNYKYISFLVSNGDFGVNSYGNPSRTWCFAPCFSF